MMLEGDCFLEINRRMKSQPSVLERTRCGVYISEEDMVWRYVRSTGYARRRVGSEEGATMEVLRLESI